MNELDKISSQMNFNLILFYLLQSHVGNYVNQFGQVGGIEREFAFVAK